MLFEAYEWHRCFLLNPILHLAAGRSLLGCQEMTAQAFLKVDNESQKQFENRCLGMMSCWWLARWWKNWCNKRNRRCNFDCFEDFLWICNGFCVNKFFCLFDCYKNRHIETKKYCNQLLFFYPMAQESLYFSHHQNLAYWFVCMYIYIYNHIYLEPIWPVFLGVDRHHFMGQIFQNMGHVGSRYIYI